MTEASRTVLTRELAALEQTVAGALELVAAQVERVGHLLGRYDDRLVNVMLRSDDPIDDAFRAAQEQDLALIALHTPVAGDLRVALALLQIARHAERMGDQCVNIAKVVSLPDSHPRDHEISALLVDMAQRVHNEVVLARETLVDRDLELAATLEELDAQVGALNRETFRSALTADDREWAMSMVLVARSLERIGDNAVDIGEQVRFAETGEVV